MDQPFTTRPEIRGTFGAVSSTHWIASAVAMGILERGGNAFDAVVSAGFTLQIVEPHLNGPGGDVSIILQGRNDTRPHVLCGQGVAPSAATIDVYRDLGLRLVPGTGLLAAVVPGSFDAWMLLLRDYGSLSLRAVLEPAIGYAESGFPVIYGVAASIHDIADYFRKEWPSSAAVWLPGNNPPLPNQIMATPTIAETYKRILREAERVGADREAQIEAARKSFYEGFVAEAIDRFCVGAEAFDSTGRRNKGLLRGDDLTNWRASYETPLSYEYHGLEFHKIGPWGQGPVLLQTLALLKGFDLAAMDPTGDRFVHTVVECIKLAFADRDVHYGDPNFVDVPIDTLLSDTYNDARRKLVSDTASDQLSAGALADDDARIDVLQELAGSEIPAEAGSGEPTFADVPEFEGDTVHVDVVDRWGNIVAATPSGGWLQSSPAIPELGFNLTTRGQMFWLDERLPSSLAPGKRPRTTLTPTLATRDGAPYLAFGTPGGDQQDQWSLILLLRHLHHKHNLQAAIDAPLFNSKHFTSSFYPRAFSAKELMIEGRFDNTVLDALAARGHKLSIQGDWALGRLCAVARGKNGDLRAAATPRLMQAYAIGR